ncbi:MAG: hypothetical protein JRN54_04830 [Nitrososphaerota archaeon]|nr:hypothetical protein [Nitrososphaerota archaeon]
MGIRNTPEIRKRRTVAIALLAVAIGIDALGVFVFPHVNEITLATSYDQTGAYWPNAPPFAVHFEFTFKATGSVSLSNPVKVTVTITSINLTDFEFFKYYDGVGFSGAFNASTINSKQPLLANIPVHQQSDGSLSGNATIIWLQDGPTVPFLTPHSTNWYLNNQALASDGPVLNVAGESDTLAIQTSMNTQRLTWILIGFSILMLQPVLEAILRVR